jgi:hypothetical protein
MMLRLWPTVEEERNRSGWRHLSIVMQVVLFVLTVSAIQPLNWFAHVIGLPKGWTTLLICLPIAEVLICRLRFWRTGVEAALWVGGLVAFILSLPSSGKPEAILLFVAAAAIAGWRVRNALFGALAFVLTAVYLIAKDRPWSAFGFAMLVTLIALFALTRIIRRPSTESLWQVAVLAMPVAGYAGIKTDAAPDLRIIAMYAVLAMVFLIVAIRFRIRVLLIATAVASAIAAIEARELIPLSNEMRLIVAGAIALAIATWIMRTLRGRQVGFVIGEPKQSDLDDVLTVAPALVSVHIAGSGTTPQRVDDGGEFGGGGASGNY